MFVHECTSKRVLSPKRETLHLLKRFILCILSIKQNWTKVDWLPCGSKLLLSRLNTTLISINWKPLERVGVSSQKVETKTQSAEIRAGFCLTLIQGWPTDFKVFYRRVPNDEVEKYQLEVHRAFKSSAIAQNMCSAVIHLEAEAAVMAKTLAA